LLTEAEASGEGNFAASPFLFLTGLPRFINSNPKKHESPNVEMMTNDKTHTRTEIHITKSECQNNSTNYLSPGGRDGKKSGGNPLSP
jgi:hypothetical protein